MQELFFVKDYKQNDSLRKSFSELAVNIFGISFEDWYVKGFWNERYIPYSFCDNGQIVANVSVNLVDLIVAGKLKKAVQIGTVMTHQDYRGQGLARSLLEKVLADFENKVDLFYLFANHKVLEFYPKFGFNRIEEAEYFIYSDNAGALPGKMRKLDGKDLRDLQFIRDFAIKRKSLSQVFSTEQTSGILLFYCLNVFHDHIYLLEEEEVIIICEKDGNKLHLYDVITSYAVDVEKLLVKITTSGTTEIILHFTPENISGLLSRKAAETNDVLFVKVTGESIYPEGVKHPVMAKA